MKHLSALLALMLLSATTLQAGDGVTPYRDTDTVMNAAIEDAQNTLDRFVRNAFDNSGHAGPDASVKVGFDVGQNGVEVIWVTNLTKTGRRWTGRLNNDPVFMDGVSYGDAVRFSTNQIYDWTYSLGGKAYGSYTTRVILEGLDTEARAQVRATLSDRPLPPGW